MANSDDSASPIRVALLTPTLHPGGAERQMLILAGALPRQRFDLRFIVLAESGELADQVVGLGLPLHVLGMDRRRVAGMNVGSVRAAGHAIGEYRRLVRGLDVVDAWLSPAYTWAGLLRPLAPVPVVMGGRRNLYDVAWARSRRRDLASRHIVRRLDAIVANSEAAAEDVVTREGVDPERVHVIRNAVLPAAEPGDRDRLRAGWGFRPDAVVAGCVANLKPGKGHSMLLHAAATLRASQPRLRFLLVGDGPSREAIEARIEREGLRDIVVLHGLEQDARRLYPGFDLAIQVSDTESLPNSVIEAAAAGRAVVATDVGGTREIITDEVDGLLVPRGDTDALVARVARLAMDPALRERLGSAALRRSADFAPERLAEQTAALYASLVAGRAVVGGS